MDKTTLSLDGQWRLDYFPQPRSGAVRSLPLAVPHETVQATVPGNCELDLARAGLLPEPETGLNALAWRRHEGHQWLYTRSFTAPDIPEGGRAVLRFEGIDTLADIFLNGVKIGETANMLIPHRFDVTDRLRPGENTVQVLIRSVFLETKRHAVAEHAFMWGTADQAPFRKAAYMGGWDIFPRLLVSGLWRPVALDVEGPVRIDDLAFVTGDYSRDGATGANQCHVRAFIRVDAPMERYLDGMRLRISVGNVAFAERPLRTVTSRVDFKASGFDLWWPADAGNHPLYDATAEIVAPDGEVLASAARRIGFRTVELERDDNYGPQRPGRFLFRVNGEPIYIRGTNWVPTDAIPSRQADRILPTLALVEECHCNLVRVWGGGVYEPDFFYDWCDEHGVLVWQDFMTGCAQTPQDDAYAAATAAEVRAVALRLRSHPSLAIWAGNNENDDAINWSRLAGVSSPDPGTDRVSREVIPRVLREFDPTRPYLPSSPYLSPDVVAGLARPAEAHLWGARDWYKTFFYLDSTACFASETGWHGCPNRDSLERMMTPEGVYPWKDGPDGSAFDWNDEWRLKASNPFLAPDSDLWNRNDLMTRQVARLFGTVPRDLDEFIAASQFFQAEALKTMVERFRARKFAPCCGLVWWNLRDGWPQLSDAVVDWYGGRKAAFAALRDAQRPVLALVLDDGSAWIVNDTLRPVAVRAAFRDRDSGAMLLQGEWTVADNASLRVGDVSWSHGGHGFIDIEYAVGDAPAERGHYLYGEAPFSLDFARAALLRNPATTRHELD
ncbi:MAG: glycoside hydrolase family 2 [Kiritimatiellae bacterium]|nr:glycoside hydrolase family 2 [Kiritimatiellia bacterium]